MVKAKSLMYKQPIAAYVAAMVDIPSQFPMAVVLKSATLFHYGYHLITLVSRCLKICF